MDLGDAGAKLLRARQPGAALDGHRHDVLAAPPGGERKRPVGPHHGHGVVHSVQQVAQRLVGVLLRRPGEGRDTKAEQANHGVGGGALEAGGRERRGAAWRREGGRRQSLRQAHRPRQLSSTRSKMARNMRCCMTVAPEAAVASLRDGEATSSGSSGTDPKSVLAQDLGRDTRRITQSTRMGQWHNAWRTALR